MHYKSNFYSVPQGTYTGEGLYVTVTEKGRNLEICGPHPQGELPATHDCCYEQGKTIINTNHKRDTSQSLEQMTGQVCDYFKDHSAISTYLGSIRKRYPRYFRDHLEVFLKVLKKDTEAPIENALAFCIKNSLYDAADFKKVLSVSNAPKPADKPGLAVVKPMYSQSMDKATERPQKSNLDDYEKIMNP